MYEDLKRYTRWLGGWVLVVYFLVVLVSKSPVGRPRRAPARSGSPAAQC